MKKQDIRHFRDLEVYRRAFEAAMAIFQLTKGFPAEEKYSLLDQIRRASRSVCANIAEAWRKRRYIAVFKNKITERNLIFPGHFPQFMLSTGSN